MPYYFNTINQDKGDLAFNENDYNSALKFYKNGLADLKKQAATKKLSTNQQFLDAYAFVCGEIIVTLCTIMSTIPATDSAALQKHWNDILSHLALMEEKVARFNKTNNYKTNQKQLNLIYTALVTNCESISDALLDAAEIARQSFTLDKEEEIKTIRNAMQWMNMALEYVEYTDLTTSFSMYLGLLHMHERLYKLLDDKNILKEMQMLLADPPVSPRFSNQVSDIQRLEWQVHRLTVAKAFNLPRLLIIAKHCKRDLERCIHMNSLVVEEATQLLADLSITVEKVNPESLMDIAESRALAETDVTQDNMILDDSNFSGNKNRVTATSSSIQTSFDSSPEGELVSFPQLYSDRLNFLADNTNTNNQQRQVPSLYNLFQDITQDDPEGENPSAMLQ